MSLIRLLILSLFLFSIFGCGYSFVLDKGSYAIKVSLDPSHNQTVLREAGMILDSNLETALDSMGMLSSKGSEHTLQCTLVSTSKQITTSSSLSSDDRYRLNISVSAILMDTQGKKVWSSTFTDDGTYSEGGQPEDALDEACLKVSNQIARAIASLSL
ncbi:MAG TPA: hypothetical protein ENN05_07400 [Deltaproteobacteria bacterium]|nr:hypothetical protein [Deltaproteobacteria bacterium]